VTSASGSERSKHDCGPSTGKEGVQSFSMTKTHVTSATIALA
jgi:hypothetical protein